MHQRSRSRSAHCSRLSGNTLVSPNRTMRPGSMATSPLMSSPVSLKVPLLELRSRTRHPVACRMISAWTSETCVDGSCTSARAGGSVGRGTRPTVKRSPSAVRSIGSASDPTRRSTVAGDGGGNRMTSSDVIGSVEPGLGLVIASPPPRRFRSRTRLMTRSPPCPRQGGRRNREQHRTNRSPLLPPCVERGTSGRPLWPPGALRRVQSDRVPADPGADLAGRDVDV